MNSAMAVATTRMAIRRMMANRGGNGGGGSGHQQIRSYYKGPISTPPMVYVPFWEKCGHFAFLTVALFGYPLWVCYWSEYYVKKGKGEIE